MSPGSRQTLTVLSQARVQAGIVRRQAVAGVEQIVPAERGGGPAAGLSWPAKSGGTTTESHEVFGSGTTNSYELIGTAC